MYYPNIVSSGKKIKFVSSCKPEKWERHKADQCGPAHKTKVKGMNPQQGHH